jgi:hypothetical protein
VPSVDAPALALWISTLGYRCLTDWIEFGDSGVRMGDAIRCFATLLLTSIPLSAALLIMLRYGAFLQATESSIMGGLAVAAITAFALSVFQDLEASVMVLIWNLGVAAAIAGLASVFGRGMFAWMTRQRNAASLPETDHS